MHPICDIYGVLRRYNNWGKTIFNCFHLRIGILFHECYIVIYMERGLVRVKIAEIFGFVQHRSGLESAAYLLSVSLNLEKNQAYLLKSIYL